MVFAPALGFAILLIVVIRLLAICSLIYIFHLLVKCFRKPEYVELIKKKPIIFFIKISIAITLVGVGLLEYISTSKALSQTKEEMVAWDKEINPVLEKETSIGGLLLPKGTKIESYNSKRNTFLNATFSDSFTFRELEIT